MDVIGWTPDSDGVAADFFCDGPEVGMSSGAEFSIFQVGGAILCREDDVDEDFGVGLRHLGFLEAAFLGMARGSENPWVRGGAPLGHKVKRVGLGAKEAPGKFFRG
jgi:hypothetical protein